jgi:hypothetical protein
MFESNSVSLDDVKSVILQSYKDNDVIVKPIYQYHSSLL